MDSKSQKFLLAGAIFLFINGFFVAEVPQATRPELAFVSAFFVIIIALPAFIALKNWLGSSRAIAIGVALGLYALFIETVAIHTGLPYGHFQYGDKIGAKIGVVPWTVFFSWSPLVLGAYALAARQSKKLPAFFAFSVGFLLWSDALLDPGAVQQGFWKFDAGGLYYGVPFSNFCGWVFSGLIGTAIVWVLSGKRSDVPVSLVSSLVLVLSFWTAIALFADLWIAAVFGVTLLSWCARQISRAKPTSSQRFPPQSS